MIVTLEIPAYNKEEGLTIHWDNGFTIKVDKDNETTHIRANKAGLVSLAVQLLTLAREEVPPGRHIHYDCYGSLEGGSSELIIEKMG